MKSVAAFVAVLLLPGVAGAINVCGNGVCETKGIPPENATNCPADCGVPPPVGLPSDLRGLTSCPWGSYDCNPPLAGTGAVAQVNALFDGSRSQRVHFLTEAGGQEPMNMFWHWQSIQRVPYASDGRYVVLSRSVDGAPGLVHVYRLGEVASASGEPFGPGTGNKTENVQRNSVVADLRTVTQKRNHAGGSQLLGKILGVGLECHGGQSVCSGLKAGVAFHDLSTPWTPVAKGNFEASSYTNAGTVSLANDQFLMIVGEGDAAKLNFYLSPGLFTGWVLKDSWSTSTDTVFTTIGDTNYGAYQNLHLVADGTENGKLYLVATHRNGGGEDWTDLYRIDVIAGEARLTKVAKKHMTCNGYCNFDAGAGAYVTPGGRLVVYGIEHYPDGCSGDCSRAAEY